MSLRPTGRLTNKPICVPRRPARPLRQNRQQQQHSGGKCFCQNLSASGKWLHLQLCGCSVANEPVPTCAFVCVRVRIGKAEKKVSRQKRNKSMLTLCFEGEKKGRRREKIKLCLEASPPLPSPPAAIQPGIQRPLRGTHSGGARVDQRSSRSPCRRTAPSFISRRCLIALAFKPRQGRRKPCRIACFPYTSRSAGWC